MQKGLPALGSDASYTQGSSPFLLGYENTERPRQTECLFVVGVCEFN